MRTNARLVGMGLGLLAATAVVGCKKGGAAGDEMAMVPKETNVVVHVSMKRLREAPLWKKVQETLNSDAKAKKQLAGFTAKTGLDPLTQIDSAFIAMPSDTKANDAAVVVKGEFNEDKLISYAKDEAKKDGKELKTEDYDGKKVYSQGTDGFGTFVDKNTFLAGGKEWGKKSIDLATGKGKESAKDNSALMDLVKKVDKDAALWVAGLVPADAAAQLGSNPEMAEAKSLKAVYGSLDFKSGFALDTTFMLGAAADATALAKKLQDQIAQGKKMPQVQMMGMAPLIDGIKVKTDGANLNINVNWTQAQVDQLVQQVQGLLKSITGGGQ